MKPLWWLFPDDATSWEHEDYQFMMGSEIMIAPVLTSGDSKTLSTKLDVYFPGKDKWFDANGTSYTGGKT
jgi:alpha-glucosidase (family GH31 glycosyl hydrolase)